MEEMATAATVERVSKFRTADLHDLCDAADLAIRDGGGFGWVDPPPRDVMERYWKGVLIVPERHLFIARLDGVVAGSAQLVAPPRNNEAQAHSAQLTTSFVAPWARGHGLARMLVRAVEMAAREAGYRVLNLDVRETQRAAIALYETLGFRRWGTHPLYANVRGQSLAGHFFYKDLTSTDLPSPQPLTEAPT
ncbi:GNAT family N-acetyltransferase [Skermanella mucosa]|nr:GNAT family N-acetyltransferase [Skermanella mucosa]UEM21042.1 GNAT family N-acetyltransferase [Skermanella mucosa]